LETRWVRAHDGDCLRKWRVCVCWVLRERAVRAAGCVALQQVVRIARLPLTG
jgi:hypothetical protein